MLRRVASRTQPRGGADTVRRRFRIALLVAVLLHLPAVPQLGMLTGLAQMLRGPQADWDYDDTNVVIPVLLEEAPVEEVPEITEPAAPPTEPLQEAEPVNPAPKKPKKKKEDEGLDAGPDVEVADAAEDADAELDAGDELDAEAPDATDGLDAGVEVLAEGEVADAGADAAPSEALAEGEALDAGAEGVAMADAGSKRAVEDTLGLTGGLTKVVQGKPNIALVLWFDALREHPIGAMVSEILQCEPQWREFLGGAIDPVRDFDGVMLTGPRFTDSSKVTVAVQHRLPKEKVRELIGEMVARSGDAGAFLDTGTDEIVAKAYADRAERIVFTHPRDMVFITPEEGFEQIRSIKRALSLPPGKGRTVSLTLVNPYRPLRAFRVEAPQTLTELRLDIVLTSDGSANVTAEFDDIDEETAKASAKVLTEQLARSALGPFVGNKEFVAQGSRVVGSIRLSRLTSALVLGFVRAAACPAEASPR